MKSIRSYLEKNVVKQSLVVLILMGCISIATSYFLARYKMASDIKDEAASVAKAYRNKFLEGDIKVSETQIRELLHLKEDESAFILKPNKDRFYKAIGSEIALAKCPTTGEACFAFGSATVYLPMYFDSQGESLFGYLYLKRNIHIDWVYVSLVFFIFCLGYAVQIFGFSNMARRAAWKLGREIEIWSERLEKNPKSDTPLQEPPFSELQKLKTSIEGLHSKIRYFETEASNKAKLLLLRGIAHDILSPVAQMQMYCATLDKAAVPSDVRETLEDIKDSLERVSLIATQVKALNEEQPVEHFDLSEFVMEEVNQIRTTSILEEKKIQIDVQGAAQVSANITKAEASRILRNLVQNSIHASKDGATISVQIGKKDNCALLQVMDTGAGIPANLHAKVFDPDFTSKSGTGTGLGLAIVKHICVKREGLVSLESKPHQGTTVTVRLPLLGGAI